MRGAKAPITLRTRQIVAAGIARGHPVPGRNEVGLMGRRDQRDAREVRRMLRLVDFQHFDVVVTERLAGSEAGMVLPRPDRDDLAGVVFH